MDEIKNIKIKNVTGLRHMNMLDKLDGKTDVKRGQVRAFETGISTPRIVQMCRSCDQFSNELYLMAMKELKELYTEISICVEELKLLGPDKGIKESKAETEADATADKMRAEARAAARKQEKRERRKSLILRLAELRQNCENIDETLRHNLDRTSAVLRSHVEAYWAGVLWGAADSNYPVMPTLIEESISGKPVYEEHYMKVTQLLESVFNGGEAA